MKTDRQIQKDVMDELRWEPILDAAEIGVAVHNGIVTLSGTVDNYMKELAAEKAAKRVRDVKAVAMDIEVRLGVESQRNDTELAEAAVDALKWNSLVPADKLRVKVDNGWVTLEGEVKWYFQKRAAYEAVHSLTGVKGVSNHISLAPNVNAFLVKSNIKKALQRNADVEADRIKIEASGNKVVLKGTVHSWNERRIVENAVWSSPGVVAVEDDLAIGI